MFVSAFFDYFFVMGVFVWLIESSWWAAEMASLLLEAWKGHFHGHAGALFLLAVALFAVDPFVRSLSQCTVLGTVTLAASVVYSIFVRNVRTGFLSSRWPPPAGMSACTIASERLLDVPSAGGRMGSK